MNAGGPRHAAAGPRYLGFLGRVPPKRRRKRTAGPRRRRAAAAVTAVAEQPGPDPLASKSSTREPPPCSADTYQLVITRPGVTGALSSHMRACLEACVGRQVRWSCTGTDATVGPFVLRRPGGAAERRSCANLPDALLWGLACLASPAPGQPPRLGLHVALGLRRVPLPPSPSPCPALRPCAGSQSRLTVENACGASPEAGRWV